MHLGNHSVFSRLRQTRFGVFYQALSSDDRPVEIFTLTQNHTDQELQRWLRTWLRRLARFDHPAVRRVFQCELDQEPAYLVLEPRAQQSLHTALSRQLPVAPARVRSLLQTLGEVLQQAHQFGLAHGSLRPDEVYLRPDGSLLIDFFDALTRPNALDFAPTTWADFASDGLELGRLGAWLLQAEEPIEPTQIADPVLGQLIGQLLAKQPHQRPSMASLLESLAKYPSSPPSEAETGDFDIDESRSDHADLTLHAPPMLRTESNVQRGRSQLIEHLHPTTGPEEISLGRFRLLEALGQGGMGTVYRARDEADDTIVAIKKLRGDWAADPNLRRRFAKEVRLLAQVHNPYVANLLEVNEAAGTPYLVMEYVPGPSLGTWLRIHGRLSEPSALAIMADVCRALVDAHRHGIIHRDIKPDNILLSHAPASESDLIRSSGPHAKLSDFGLARHLLESGSLDVTQFGAILGTLNYMSPEQCTGTQQPDARWDVYAIGATLFHLLTGRPPFLGDSPTSLIAQHLHESPPGVRTLHHELSDGVAQVINKSLAKQPEQRYADAGQLLDDLERLLRGEPTRIHIHPRAPDYAGNQVIQYEWSWQLAASAAELWPHVSNTERVNRAVGLPPVQYTAEPDPSGKPGRFGHFTAKGFAIRWQEHPYEWVEGCRFGVLREYHQGPFKWLVSAVEFRPQRDGGTTLIHRVWLEPRWRLGRLVAALEVGRKARQAFDRLYRRIGAALAGRLSSSLTDPFEDPESLSRRQRRCLEQQLDRLAAEGVHPSVFQRVGDFLASAPAQEIARIRPRVLAQRLNLDEHETLTMLLKGAVTGLVLLKWDILCPVCQISACVADTLREVRHHGRCDACHLDFTVDFARSIELIFQAHPTIRQADLGTYCIGGPVHLPHVVAQVRVAAGERLNLELHLGAGRYCLRGPQLGYALELRVDALAFRSRWEVQVDCPSLPAKGCRLRPGEQLLALSNDSDQEVLIRLERSALREDAVTAAQAAASTLFRDLFPEQVLAPGQLVSVTNLTLLVTDLIEADELYRQWGESRVFGMLCEQFRLLEACVQQHGGGVVKTLAEGVLAAFTDPVAGVRAALEIPDVLRHNGSTASLRPRVGVHRGPVMAVTLNDRLDYFGRSVNIATQLLELATESGIILSSTLAYDPDVARVLDGFPEVDPIVVNLAATDREPSTSTRP